MAANPIRGRIDTNGRLVSADPALAGLQARAGGALPGPLALPQLASLARFSIHLGQTIDRSVLIGDDDGDVAARVRIVPDADGASIAIDDWRVYAPAGSTDTSAPDAIAADLRWECDPQLRLIVLSGPRAPDLIGGQKWMGRSVSEVFALRPDGAGQFPMLRALAAQAAFQHQLAEVANADMGTRAMLQIGGEPLFDAMHGFRGFQGVALQVREPAPAPSPPTSDPAFGSLPMSDPRFGRRVDGALRGPLSRIIATAETISGQIEGPIRADYARYAGDIAHAGRHLLGLIDDLADLQNIEKPGFKAARDKIDLGDIGRRAVGLLGMKAEERAIRIVAPPSGIAVPAVGEFRRTLQILLNLLGNAIRYSPEGSTITIIAAHAGNRASISVADQGQGLTADDQARIFEKFERLGRTDAGGSGLGLYIARRLARAMDGDINIASAPGQGACFTLTLPTD